MQAGNEEKDTIILNWTSKYGNLESQLEAKANELTNLNQQLNDWQIKFKGLEEEKLALSTQMQAGNEEKDTIILNWTSKYGNLESQLEAKANELTNLNQQLNDWQIKFKGIEEEKLALSNQMEASNEEKDAVILNWTKKYGDLESQFRAKDKEIANFNQQLNDWQIKFSGLEQEKLALSTQMEASNEEKDAVILNWTNKYGSLESQLEAKANELTNLNQQLNDWQIKFKGLEEEKLALSTQMEAENEEKDAVILNWTSKYGNLENQLEAKANELTNLNQQFSDWQIKFKGLEEEKLALSTQMEAGNEEKDTIILNWTSKYGNLESQLETKANELINLNQQLRDWQIKFKGIEEEKLALSAQMQTSNEEKDTIIQNWTNKYGDLESQLQAKGQELADLNKQLYDWGIKYTGLEKEKAMLATQIRTGNKEKDTLILNWTSKYEVLEEQLKSKDKELKNLANRIVAVEQERSKTEKAKEKQINLLTSNLEKKDKAILDWSNKYESASTNYKTEFNAQQSSYTELEKEKEELINLLKKINKEQEALNKDWTKKFKVAQQSIDKKETKISGLEGQLKDLRNQIKFDLEQQRKETEDWKTNYASLEKQLAKEQSNFNKEKAQFDKEFKKLTEQIETLSELKITVKDLKSNEKRLQKEIEKLSTKTAKDSKEWGSRIEKLRAKLIATEQELAKKPKEIIREIEVIKEVPVEIIKEVEVVKSIDFDSLKEMMMNMGTVEVSKQVVGETRTTKDAKIVERREVAGSNGKVSKEASKTTKATKSLKQKVKKDDLKKIEGIGPKIEQLFHEAGIYTFEELANSTNKKRLEILGAAGPRFKMHNPKTWAQQARLAAGGKWDELKKLQDELDGGL